MKALIIELSKDGVTYHWVDVEECTLESEVRLQVVASNPDLERTEKRAWSNPETGSKTP